jgi:isopentenyl-diphosphate Delta-isomerase
MNEPFVILVDENDNQTGVAGKMEAHKKGLLHRAVSVFVINSHGNWILQRRALDKYHSNGLWTNTCCTHPHPGETDIEAAGRRLSEEMGIKCKLIELFSFIYSEKLDNDLTEHELDHVFFGVTDNVPVINAMEVEDWKAVSFGDLHEDIIKNSESYTYWFKEIYEKVNLHILNTQNNKL